MHNHSYDYSLGMMIVLFFVDISTADATVDGIFGEKNSCEAMKDGSFLVILEGHYWHVADNHFRKTGE